MQGVDGAAYANAAEQDRLRTYPIAALRGAVLDRHGRPFAYTVAASRVVADPTLVAHPARTARALAPLLDVPEADLTAKLSRHNRYVVLAAQIPPETTDAIDKLALPGISFEDDPVRLYPAGAVGGQVVGFVGRQGEGLAGIEQTYQDLLAGDAGKRRVEVGSGGNPIPSGIDESTPAVDGDTVQLSLDQDLQYVVDQRLAAACADGATTRGSAVVLDVHTGAGAAMASCPGYDPGNYSRPIRPCWATRRSPTSSSRLGHEGRDHVGRARGGQGEADTVLTVNGHISAGDRVVTDAHDHEPIKWTVTGILAKSSNVGAIMLAREVGDEKLEHYMRAFGLGSTTGIELPGESAGILEKSADWTASRAANVPIGQGVSVTTLQMASIYQTIANGGVRIEPRIVGRSRARPGTGSPRRNRRAPGSSARPPPTRWPTCWRRSSVPAAPRPSARSRASAWRARPAPPSGPTPPATATRAAAT